MNLEFSKATGADLNDLHALIELCYRGEGAKEGWTFETDLVEGERISKESLSSIIQSAGFPGGEGIVTMKDGSRLMGSVYLRYDSDALYFGMFTVDPRLQGQGLGKEFLNWIEDHARNLGYLKLRAEVIHVREELIDYYQRRGFQKTGRSTPFLGKPKGDRVLSLMEIEKAL